jgi:transposase InsO family protein
MDCQWCRCTLLRRRGQNRASRKLFKKYCLRRTSLTNTTSEFGGSSRAVGMVDRRFYSDGPDRLWADITYVPTWSGFLYLAMVLDVYSRRVVGWAMETHLKAELILAALEMALTQRRPDSVIHHSDRGCNTPAMRSESAAGKPGSCRQWVPSCPIVYVLSRRQLL